MENVNEITKNSEQLQEVQPPNKRPTFLKVLCILSFIATGWMVFSSLTGFLSGPLSPDDLEKTFSSISSMSSIFGDSKDINLVLEKTIEKQKLVNANFYLNSFINTVVYAIGFLGVLWMWRFKKKGFHVYVIYSILSLCSIYIIIPISIVLPLEIIQSGVFCSLWIALYAMNLKHMQ